MNIKCLIYYKKKIDIYQNRKSVIQPNNTEIRNIQIK